MQLDIEQEMLKQKVSADKQILPSSETIKVIANLYSFLESQIAKLKKCGEILWSDATFHMY